MSDLGKVRKPGHSPFPIIRKSADPLQPESGEAEFAQELEKFEEDNSSVRETEKTEQFIIKEEERNRESKKHKKPDKEDIGPDEDDEDTLIDVKA